MLRQINDIISKLVYYTEQRAFLTDYLQAPAEDSFTHLNCPACYPIKKSFYVSIADIAEIANLTAVTSHDEKDHN